MRNLGFREFELHKVHLDAVFSWKRKNEHRVFSCKGHHSGIYS
jgi:hypothetical protein